MLNNVKIALKVAIIVLLVTSLGVCVALYAGLSLKRISGGYDRIAYEEYPRRLALIRSSRFAVQIGYEAAEVVALSDKPAEAKAAADSSEKMYTDTRDFINQAKLDFPAQTPEFDTLAEKLEVIRTAVAPVITLGLAGKTKEAMDALAATRPAFEAMTLAFRDTNVHGLALAKGHAGELGADAAATNLTLLIVSALGAVGGIVMALMLSARTLVKPLDGLRQQMERLSRGDTAAKIGGAERRDEIGAMARTVQVFKDAAIAKAELERTAEADRARNEEQTRRQHDSEAAVAEERALVVHHLGQGLERMSAGDLTFRLGEDFPAAAAKIRDHFNQAILVLADAIRHVATNAQTLRSGAGEIAQATDNLAHRTEQQAASLEETAAALDQITATVTRTAQSAKQARVVVTDAKANAQHSGEVVREAVEAIQHIEQSSQQISQIIGVIDEIAFQTNLLALNAGVEAARAGEAGRGFAVVASEVRGLAQRSAEAAKEIKALISTSAQQVGVGVERVGETGRALSRIIEQILRIDSVVTEIAASAHEQSTGLAEVNTAINEMDQVTQRNAAMVEETTAASHTLAQESEALVRLVSAFNVTASAAQPARAKASARPAMKTLPTGRGGAVRAIETANEWESF